MEPLFLKPKNYRDLTIYGKINFNGTITDDIGFFNLLKSKIKLENMLILVESKDKLIDELKNKSYSEEQIKGLVKESIFS